MYIEKGIEVFQRFQTQLQVARGELPYVLVRRRYIYEQGRNDAGRVKVVNQKTSEEDCQDHDPTSDVKGEYDQP